MLRSTENSPFQVFRAIPTSNILPTIIIEKKKYPNKVADYCTHLCHYSTPSTVLIHCSLSLPLLPPPSLFLSFSLFLFLTIGGGSRRASSATSDEEGCRTQEPIACAIRRVTKNNIIGFQNRSGGSFVSDGGSDDRALDFNFNNPTPENQSGRSFVKSTSPAGTTGCFIPILTYFTLLYGKF